MNRTELQIFNDIQNRIDELEEEIYALTESRTIKFKPFKRIIRIKDTITKKHNYPHDVEIKLTNMDLRVLQDMRLKELNSLKNFIKD